MPGACRAPWVAATQRLKLGLLVRGDHVVVRAERHSVEVPLVEIEHSSSLGLEVRIAREDPRPIAPRLDHVCSQPPAHRRRGDRIDEPLAHRLEGQLVGAPTRQGDCPAFGWLAGHGLHAGDDSRGEHPRPSRPRPVAQSVDARFDEALAPLGGDIYADPDTPGDVDVLRAVGCQQHDPSPHHRGVRARPRRCPLDEHSPIRFRELHDERRPTAHDQPPRPTSGTP